MPFGVCLLPALLMAATFQMRIMLLVSSASILALTSLELTSIGVQFTLNQIDVMTRVQEAYPNDFSQQVDSANALEAFKQGKLISPLGIEGLHQIGNSVANLRRFHQLGTRYATLTHNCHNKFADAAILENPLRKAEPLWKGVSPLGRRVIHEMNRIGMIVDLSHVRFVAP